MSSVEGSSDASDLPRPDDPWTVRRMMVTIVLLSVPIAGATFLYRAVLSARQAANDSLCNSCLKQIGVALHNYESTWGTLPPAYTTDAAGRPSLSWRVLLLPYLERQALYARFRLDEPWSGPNNITLLDEMPREYACATLQPEAWSSRAGGRFTNFLAAAGPGTAFPGTDSVGFAQFRDGRDETILVVESNQADVPWTAPIDLNARTGQLTNVPGPGTRGPTTPHQSGLYVGTAVTSVLRLDPEKLRRNLGPVSTIAGGEPTKLDDLRPDRE